MLPASPPDSAPVPMLRTDDLPDRLRAVPALAALLPALAGESGVSVVGGVPRDLLLGRAPLDVDLVVEGDAEALAARLGTRLGGVTARHERFGTATIAVGGRPVDLARARAETYARPGALPEVRAAPLAQDLARRDFTANAIAVSLDADRLGEITAVPGALADLAVGRLRVLHPASFADDPTRLLRLVRYAARLGFAPDPATEALAVEAVRSGALKTVSPARVGAEYRLLLAESDAVDALDWASRLGLVAALDLEWRWDRGESERALALLPPDGRADLLLAGALARGATPGRLAARLDALELERGDRDRILATAGADALVAPLDRAGRPSALRAVVAGAPVEAIALAGARGAAAAARRWLAELRHVGLDIGGEDLRAAGVPQGPAIGRGLAAALDRRLDGEAPDRDAQLTVALRVAREE